MKVLTATLALLVLLLAFSYVQAMAPAAPVSPICVNKCNDRCSKAAVQDRCDKYCQLCCMQCNFCVPRGTYGNKDDCPCYRDMLNSKKKPKCP